MVGSIVLYVVALVLGSIGMISWFAATGEPETVKAMGLCVIAAITLTGALVIDGIRFYAGKLETQLSWLLKGTSGSGESSGSRGGQQPWHDAEAGGSKRRYHLYGTLTATGRETEMLVDAPDRTAALHVGEQAGLDVTRVEEAE